MKRKNLKKIIGLVCFLCFLIFFVVSAALALTSTEQHTFIINTSTGKFHWTDCRYLPTTNRLDRTTTYDQLISEGYSPCYYCSNNSPVTQGTPENTSPPPDTSSHPATFIIGQSLYTLEGASKSMDAASYIKNSRTYVPVRYLAYSLDIADGGIGWNSETQMVTLIKGDTTVTLVIGNKVRKINGDSTQMDVPPEISNGRTMLPARWVAEAFGATVGWDSTNRMVTIDY